MRNPKRPIVPVPPDAGYDPFTVVVTLIGASILLVAALIWRGYSWLAN